MTRKSLFIIAMICFSFSLCSAMATDGQRFTIFDADGRIFLLDTQEGVVYRYYFNNINEQGWGKTYFDAGSDEENDYYRGSFYGEVFPVQKAKVKK